MSGEPDYGDTIQRILDLLKDNPEFREQISEFRFGELPEQHVANSYPCCYVTTSIKPEVSRKSFGPAKTFGKKPNQDIDTEFWIILVVQKATPELTQKLLYKLRQKIYDIFEANTQLRRQRSLLDSFDTGEEDEDPDERIDPKCQDLELNTIGRFTKQRGKVMDGITIIVKTKTFKNSM